jgi:hypothetical protein
VSPFARQSIGFPLQAAERPFEQAKEKENAQEVVHVDFEETPKGTKWRTMQDFRIFFDDWDDPCGPLAPVLPLPAELGYWLAH